MNWYFRINGINMDKLLIIDKNNKLLVSMDKEDWDEIIVDNSITLSSNWEGIVIQLNEDYNTQWDAEVIIKDWEIRFKA